MKQTKGKRLAALALSAALLAGTAHAQAAEEAALSYGIIVDSDQTAVTATDANGDTVVTIRNADGTAGATITISADGTAIVESASGVRRYKSVKITDNAGNTIVNTTADNTADPAFSPWAQDYVRTAAGSGILDSGKLGRDYTIAITRARFCTLAAALYETVTGREMASEDYTAVFADANDEDMGKMYALGVITGYNTAQQQQVYVGPEDLITREQAAVMLVRLGETLGAVLTEGGTPFTDEASSWAQAGVSKVYNAGIMTGMTDTTFAPMGNYTIEQSIVSLVRLMNHVK